MMCRMSRSCSSSGRRRGTLTAITCVVATVTTVAAVGCRPEVKACTAEEAGYGGARRVEQRELPGLPEKAACQDRISVIRSESELRAAYASVGLVPERADGGAASGGPPGASLELPAIDWSRESVLFREAADVEHISWMVAQDGMLTVGTRACASELSGCRVEFLALDAVVAKVEVKPCEPVNCAVILNQ